MSAEAFAAAEVTAAVEAVEATEATEATDGKYIVVGVDGSENSREALAWALSHAALIGARVECLFAWDFPLMWGAEEDWFIPDDAWQPEQDGRRMLADVLTEITGTAPAVPVRARTVRAGAVQSLLDAAEGAELLVVGHRSHNVRTELLHRSVSTRVARLAPCPVVVVNTR